MPVILNSARPDCDFLRESHKIVVHRGCREQAQFKIWIENIIDHAYKDKPFFACRSHAKAIFDMARGIAKEMRRLKDDVVVKVEDITLTPDEKKRVKILVVKGTHKPLAVIRSKR